MLVRSKEVKPNNPLVRDGRPPPLPDAEAQRHIAMRDGNKCCITGKAGTIWDPLLVVPILPAPSGWIADKSRVFDMLGAFFGAPYRDWWLSHASDPEQMPRYRSHWLVRKSAARAFAQGFVKLDRQQPSMIEMRWALTPYAWPRSLTSDFRNHSTE